MSTIKIKFTKHSNNINAGEFCELVINKYKNTYRITIHNTYNYTNNKIKTTISTFYAKNLFSLLSGYLTDFDNCEVEINIKNSTLTRSNINSRSTGDLNTICQFYNGIIYDKTPIQHYSNVILDMGDMGSGMGSGIVRKSLYKNETDTIYEFKFKEIKIYNTDLIHTIKLLGNFRANHPCKMLSDNYIIIKKSIEHIKYLCKVYITMLAESDIIINLIRHTRNNISNNLPIELIDIILKYLLN